MLSVLCQHFDNMHHLTVKKLAEKPKRRRENFGIVCAKLISGKRNGILDHKELINLLLQVLDVLYVTGCQLHVVSCKK